MFCEKCGTKNLKNAKFCEKCGHKIIKDNKKETNESLEKIKNKIESLSKKTKIIMSMVIFIVIISIVVLGILLSNPVKKVNDYLTQYYTKYENERIEELQEIGKILKNNKKNNLFVSQYDLVSNHYEDNYIDLISAINSLEFKFKSVIVLFYYDDMDINTISYVLNLPKGTVKSRLYRAKKKLKEIMELD